MRKITKLMILLICSLSVASVAAAGTEDKNKGDSNVESSTDQRNEKGRKNRFSDDKQNYGKYKIYSGKESEKPRVNADPGT